MALHLVPAQTTTPTGATTPAKALIPVSSGDAVLLVAIFVVVILLAAFIPLLVDLLSALKWRRGLTKWLEEGKSRSNDLMPVLRLIARPRGAVNAARTTIAYLIVALVAAALGVTVFSDAGDAPDLRKTIIASVLTVLSLVIGFYFGSRTAQTAIEAQSVPGNGQRNGGGPGPVIMRLVPETGPSGPALTVTGRNLTGAEIYFGTLPADPVGPPADWQIVVAVPKRPPGYPAEVDVVAVTPVGRSEPTEATRFTFGEPGKQDPQH